MTKVTSIERFNAAAEAMRKVGVVGELLKMARNNIEVGDLVRLEAVDDSELADLVGRIGTVCSIAPASVTFLYENCTFSIYSFFRNLSKIATAQQYELAHSFNVGDLLEVTDETPFKRSKLGDIYKVVERALTHYALHVVHVETGKTRHVRYDQLHALKKVENIVDLPLSLRAAIDVKGFEAEATERGLNLRFEVNEAKRTVVALLNFHGKNPYGRGIARCSPRDTFDVNIGKAIALYRATGEEVPEEFLNGTTKAPEEPTLQTSGGVSKREGRFKVGDVVTLKYVSAGNKSRGYDFDDEVKIEQVLDGPAYYVSNGNGNGNILVFERQLETGYKVGDYIRVIATDYTDRSKGVSVGDVFKVTSVKNLFVDCSEFMFFYAQIEKVAQ